MERGSMSKFDESQFMSTFIKKTQPLSIAGLLGYSSSTCCSPDVSQLEPSDFSAKMVKGQKSIGFQS